MHLYVNNSEAKIHFWINSAPGGGHLLLFSTREADGSIASARHRHGGGKIRIYVCIYITSFSVS